MEKFYRINGLVILSFLVLVSLLLMQRERRLEAFVVASNEVVPQKNYTDAIWDRHPIEDSLPLDYVVKYPNAYYNELDNTAFMNGLISTFRPNPLMFNGSEWTKEITVDRENIPPIILSEQYKRIITWIQERLNSVSKTFFSIAGDEPAPFQIIHDHWKTWSKNLLMTNRFMYNIDIVVYREGKYHAKHIQMVVVTDKDSILGVVDIKIVGIIFEDKFGLFPVVQSDTTDLKLSNALPFDPDRLDSYPMIIDDSLVSQEVKRRQEQNSRNEKVKKILEQSSALEQTIQT